MLFYNERIDSMQYEHKQQAQSQENPDHSGFLCKEKIGSDN